MRCTVRTPAKDRPRTRGSIVLVQRWSWLSPSRRLPALSHASNVISSGVVFFNHQALLTFGSVVPISSTTVLLCWGQSVVFLVRVFSKRLHNGFIPLSPSLSISLVQASAAVCFAGTSFHFSGISHAIVLRFSRDSICRSMCQGSLQR